MRNKYGAKKTMRDGIVFDSKHEADRYTVLKAMEARGEIQDLQLQVPFELIPAQYVTVERVGANGKALKGTKKCVERAVMYKADFVYTRDGKITVEDAKGVKTKEYIIKRKLMLEKHGITIQEV